MRFRLDSPTQSLFDGEVRLVVAHSLDGEFAVMEGHEPMLAALAAAPLRIETAQGARVFAVRGGVLQVTREAVTCLAHEAIAAEAIDLEAVERERAALHRGIEDEDASPDTQRNRAWLEVQEKVGRTHG
jgi:F-type H+-transporting ATPase subunit epsilon